MSLPLRRAPTKFTMKHRTISTASQRPNTKEEMVTASVMTREGEGRTAEREEKRGLKVQVREMLASAPGEGRVMVGIMEGDRRPPTTEHFPHSNNTNWNGVSQNVEGSMWQC